MKKSLPSLQKTTLDYKKVQRVFQLLVKQDVYSEGSGFSADKDAILKIFSVTNGFEKTNILVRLTLIDSMYSTQMNRRYYALEELAEALATLASGKEAKLRDLFLAFAKDPEKYSQDFNYGGTNLFSESYGIGKDGSDKGVAISLISKYAYFETKFKFPIYDSIACEMYLLVCRECGFDKYKKINLTVKENGKIQGEQTMVAYVKAINWLIEQLDCKGLNYDLLDRFLWFVGKIRRGNLSLVLTRTEYEIMMKLYPPTKIVRNTKIGTVKNIIEYFNIDKIEINKIPFLKNNELLRNFFEMAQYYGYKN